MFSDTHFHFHNLTEERNLNGKEILTNLIERKTFFALDIGTKADDLNHRQSIFTDIIQSLDEDAQKKAEDMLYFSAGIWPDPESIKNRNTSVKVLEEQIKKALSSDNAFYKKICAIGECGLDHHWNPSGVDGRNENDFDEQMYIGEKELFLMQLELAQKMNKPVIVHSRDAYEDTVNCIREAGYNNGIIHCYSYGINEAKTFLDMGWYIAFGGAVTYTKKSKIQEMEELLRYVPEDRLLLETDAPYLTPVPFRGQTNTPVLVEYVYNYVAQARSITPFHLSEIADKNIKTLFKL